MQLRGGSIKRSWASKAALTFYGLVGAGFSTLLTVTLWRHPLIPLNTSSVDWCRSWLITTVVDYYGAALCLCGVAISSEPSWQGWAWSAGFCALGTPVCTLYVASRLWRFGSLQLAQ